MKNLRCGLVLLWNGLLLLLAGCSSVSVQPKVSHAVPADVPRRIVVADFGYADDSHRLRVDREGAELRAFKRDLSARMSASLVKDLSRFGLPVEQETNGQPPLGPPGWLVTGQFTRVNQGSRALRVIVGAGAGATKMETRVKVRQIDSGRLVCAFRTTGGSNADSGIITSYGPLTVATLGGALINIAGTSDHGVTEDTRRTAKMIADYVSQRLAQRGVIPWEKAREPKILDGPVDPLGSLKN